MAGVVYLWDYVNSLRRTVDWSANKSAVKSSLVSFNGRRWRIVG